jgi:hypothetical protein
MDQCLQHAIASEKRDAGNDEQRRPSAGTSAQIHPKESTDRKSVSQIDSGMFRF